MNPSIVIALSLKKMRGFDNPVSLQSQITYQTAFQEQRYRAFLNDIEPLHTLAVIPFIDLMILVMIKFLD